MAPNNSLHKFPRVAAAQRQLGKLPPKTRLSSLAADLRFVYLNSTMPPQRRLPLNELEGELEELQRQRKLDTRCKPTREPVAIQVQVC
jgi:hypothetical protein